MGPKTLLTCTEPSSRVDHWLWIQTRAASRLATGLEVTGEPIQNTTIRSIEPLRRPGNLRRPLARSRTTIHSERSIDMKLEIDRGLKEDKKRTMVKMNKIKDF